jgi:hypothetical protein
MTRYSAGYLVFFALAGLMLSWTFASRLMSGKLKLNLRGAPIYQITKAKNPGVYWALQIGTLAFALGAFWCFYKALSLIQP